MLAIFAAVSLALRHVHGLRNMDDPALSTEAMMAFQASVGRYVEP